MELDDKEILEKVRQGHCLMEWEVARYLELIKKGEEKHHYHRACLHCGKDFEAKEEKQRLCDEHHILKKQEFREEIEAIIEDWNRWMMPRDPARIDRILKLVGERWKESPDLRFFQLLEGIFGCPKKRTQCFFYQEDGVTEEKLKDELK